jgi:hypothetical protein
MNTYKVKAISATNLLAQIAKRTSSTKTSQTSISSQSMQPDINRLYSIDFMHTGSLQRNVIARYAGMSKSGKFMNFELLSFYTAQGVKVRMISLNAVPSKIKLLKQNLFASTCKHASNTFVLILISIKDFFSLKNGYTLLPSNI